MKFQNSTTTYILFILFLNSPLFLSAEILDQIQGESYPVSIDRSIRSAEDDAEEFVSSGEINFYSTDLEMVEDGSEQIVGLRFRDIDLPRGAVISNAYLQFSVDEANTRSTLVNFRAEAADDAAAIEGTIRNISNRSFTQNSVSWQIQSWNAEYTRTGAQRSPDLGRILQEVIDRDAWKSGNSVLIRITGSGKRTAISFDKEPDHAPQLVIEAEVPLPSTQISGLFINELMAAGTRVLDDAGEASDWVEIYNAGSEDLHLGGLFLTDDLANPYKWQIQTAVGVGAGDFAILWLDGEVEEGGRHAPFKLDKDGEELALIQVLDGQNIILDQVVFPELPANVTYGRESDGAEPWVKLAELSPGASNNGKGRFLDAQLTFSLEGGVYSSNQELSIQSSLGDAEIYYTTDGSIPTTSDFLYTETLNLDRTTLLRARAFKPGFAGGEIKTETYFIRERHTLPIIHIQSEPENFFDNEFGIYVSGLNGVTGFCSNQPRNWNQNWERPIHLSFYEPDGTEAFSVNAGSKIGGGCSRAAKMKSMNFYFRGSVYGDAKVNYPVFPNLDIEEFNRLKIRNSGNDFEQMGFRDGAIQSLLYNTIDLDLMAYRPVVTYLNGRYWGIYGLRELYNEDYVASHHDVDPDNIDLITNPYAGGEIHEGDRVAFETLQNYIESRDLSVESNYEYVASQIDINEFINYHVVEIYIANYDWPANNLRVWRGTETMANGAGFCMTWMHPQALGPGVRLPYLTTPWHMPQLQMEIGGPMALTAPCFKKIAGKQRFQR